MYLKGFSGGSDGNASVCNAGDLGSIPGLGRSPGEGNGNPLQYSCLENSMELFNLIIKIRRQNLLIKIVFNIDNVKKS